MGSVPGFFPGFFFEVLKELKKMKDDGLITPEEYEAKKKDILGKM